MKPLRKLAREAADAALQLTLPLFEGPLRSPKAPPGRRMVQLNQRYLDYELRRSRRRTIGMVIDDRGLSVTAPRWVPIGDIESALQDKADWIERKLVEWRDHAARRERLTIRWEDGASLPFLGEMLTMRVDPSVAGSPVRIDGELRFSLAPDASSEQFKNVVQGWLQNEAQRLFGQRLAEFSPRLGRAPTRWRLSSARTRWGSCGPDGSIRLNWRLVHFPQDIIDYVIAHELAHLRELNHGPKFWQTVGELFPEFEQARNWLRSYPDDLSLS